MARYSWCWRGWKLGSWGILALRQWEKRGQERIHCRRLSWKNQQRRFRNVSVYRVKDSYIRLNDRSWDCETILFDNNQWNAEWGPWNLVWTRLRKRLIRARLSHSMPIFLLILGTSRCLFGWKIHKDQHSEQENKSSWLWWFQLNLLQRHFQACHRQ